MSSPVVLNLGGSIPHGASKNFQRGASPFVFCNMGSFWTKEFCPSCLFKVRGGAWNKGQLLKGGMAEKKLRITGLVKVKYKFKFILKIPVHIIWSHAMFNIVVFLVKPIASYGVPALIDFQTMATKSFSINIISWNAAIVSCFFKIKKMTSASNW